jgi:putative acetyltransferase
MVLQAGAPRTAKAVSTSFRDTSPRIDLVDAAAPPHHPALRTIFVEYADGLGIDLGFQNFDAELADLPGEYAPPAGALLLALVDGSVAGCAAMRPLPGADPANACEMKRLYVRPAFRRFGLGRLLAQALMDKATAAGYSTMLLDTLDDMEAARGLYASLGFEETSPYYFNPIPGAHYLRARL